MDRPAGRAVPQHAGLALVGDSDRRQPVAADPRAGKRDMHAVAHILPDFRRVMLHPARTREDLLVLLLGHGDDRRLFVEHTATRLGGVLVDRRANATGVRHGYWTVISAKLLSLR